MIEPASLSNQIEAATCLVYHLNLILETSINRIFKDAAFLVSLRLQRLTAGTILLRP